MAIKFPKIRILEPSVTYVSVAALTTLTTKDQIWSRRQTIGLGTSRDGRWNGRRRVRWRGDTRVLRLNVQTALGG